MPCNVEQTVSEYLAGADNITFTLGNHPQPGEENVLMGSQRPLFLLVGFTNLSNTEVDFSSNELIFSHGGQASIFASDGLINDHHLPAGPHLYGPHLQRH
jgi:hypothetical protein